MHSDRPKATERRQRRAIGGSGEGPVRHTDTANRRKSAAKSQPPEASRPDAEANAPARKGGERTRESIERTKKALDRSVCDTLPDTIRTGTEQTR